jgi:hypothetical protein
MPAEAGLFEVFYAGPIQHPLLLWAAALAAGAFCLTRRGLDPGLRRYCALLTALSLADAWLTSNHVYGIGALPAWAASSVPLFFVLAGDYRYFLLLEAATPDGRFAPAPRALAVAAGFTLIVPVFSQLALSFFPDAGARVLFFVYELSFLGLLVTLMARHPKLQDSWLRRVSLCVLLYYSLWAGADAILLATGSDLGFGLRVVPNLLYYGGLIAWIGASAPRRATGA